MKKIFTIVLSATALAASAQWSNTSNYFEDSLHMAVSNALQVQKNPILLTSYPDNGYFVIWEDDRNTATSKTDIYAQKYDKAGNRLWAADGVPIVTGPNNQHYYFSSNQDYRSRSFAATDSAGGFYICYSDDSVSNYVWERAMVQHVRSNGTGVFASPGYFIARSNVANLAFSSQLIADGSKGFFIAYRGGSNIDNLYVYNYRDINGTLRFYGGGKVNENAIETSIVANCGIKTDVQYPGTTLTDYNIWSDLDGGCNVIMSMVGNGLQGTMLGYNKVWKAKKDSRVKTFFRNVSGSACQRITDYRKGDAYLLYYIVRDFQRVACGGGSGPVYVYTNNRLLSNGFQLIDDKAYDYGNPKGVTIATGTNMNVNLFAAVRRNLANNVLSDFTVQGYVYKSEVFDSLPYQRCTYSNPEIGFNPIAPPSYKLNFFRDTLLGFSNGYPDFSLASGGSNIYAASLMSTSGNRVVRLQRLAISKKAADSFAIEYKTNSSGTPNKPGEAIGMENSTGFTGDISFDLPMVTVAKNGQGFFYIREYYRYARVSPISFLGVQLSWGAMGKPVGTGYYNSGPYTVEQPFVALDSNAKTAVVCWKDSRNLPGNTSDNIFMRHLDNVDIFNYAPPVKKIKTVINFFGATYANPAALLGSSKNYTTMDVFSSYGASAGTSPIMNIYDNNNLGRIKVSINQNTGAIRRYNGSIYLDRNYSFVPENDATGKQITMILYFTNDELNAMKAADPSITSPDYLSVIRQPSTSAAAGATYTPVAGEELITPTSWDSLEGGYGIHLTANGTGNFFIQKLASVSTCAAVNTSFISNITGATYQWQENTGTNWVNITNGGNYSGATIATLQISNTPSAFNGYRYRCVIDNTKTSNTFFLEVANKWTGAVNNLWETAGNWSCSTVPTATTDVIITSGAPTVNSTTAICRSIKLSPGASVNVTPGFKLTVSH